MLLEHDFLASSQTPGCSLHSSTSSSQELPVQPSEQTQPLTGSHLSAPRPVQSQVCEQFKPQFGTSHALRIDDYNNLL
ncbi:hypothetical protein DPMN_181747 [Dreissena polymorpha]|uniref:Uncharacterized protein n=1 Tax=Dreissena polymorpha TaxID=45954 RepID=A0A9D4DFV3_DREPO|nr:hypothetical protein DPMN_181747 [Dreissena polymorpha]